MIIEKKRIHCEEDEYIVPPAPKPRPTGSVFEQLVNTQDFEGFWSDLKHIEQLAKCKIELDPLSGNALVTVFAIALLELSGNESVWILIRDKAMRWLKSQDSTYDWDKAIAEVKAYISK